MQNMTTPFDRELEERFVRYAQIDTQADEKSTTAPSTAQQFDLLNLLVEELKAIGAQEVTLTEYGAVIATIPATPQTYAPAIAFLAHVDTAPAFHASGVKPIVHRAYAGGDIALPDDPEAVLSPARFPYLAGKMGDDIITASGTTLLGADDKAGVAIIMAMAGHLLQNPGIPHGTLRILFTPDEEIGRGVDRVELARLGAVACYTLDGSERGSLEDETFSADGLELVIQGVSAHPGFAKGKMVNAIKAAAAFVEALPKVGMSPETTEGREGFLHPVQISGSAEAATVELILRDFRTARLDQYCDLASGLMQEVAQGMEGISYVFTRREQYRNMREVLEKHPEVTARAEEAIRRAGMTVRKHPVRGGTDGSRLSFMGLPSPNLFTGEMAFHSRQEFVSVQDMLMAVDTLVELAGIWAQES